MAAGIILGASPSIFAGAADFNGDGNPDFAVPEVFFGGAQIVNFGDGNGNFTGSPVMNARGYAVAAGDLNGDNKPDLVFADRDGNSLMVVLNDGTGKFGDPTQYENINRPWSIALIAIVKPSPSSPTRFAAGTSQSSNVRIPVLPARTPSLPWRDSELKPGNERSTMKAVMPLWPFERSTLAKTST